MRSEAPFVAGGARGGRLRGQGHGVAAQDQRRGRHRARGQPQEAEEDGGRDGGRRREAAATGTRGQKDKAAAQQLRGNSCPDPVLPPTQPRHPTTYMFSYKGQQTTQECLETIFIGCPTLQIWQNCLSCCAIWQNRQLKT